VTDNKIFIFPDLDCFANGETPILLTEKSGNKMSVSVGICMQGNTPIRRQKRFVLLRGENLLPNTWFNISST
jgi:hypothetical protein